MSSLELHLFGFNESTSLYGCRDGDSGISWAGIVNYLTHIVRGEAIAILANALPSLRFGDSKLLYQETFDLGPKLRDEFTSVNHGFKLLRRSHTTGSHR